MKTKLSLTVGIIASLFLSVSAQQTPQITPSGIGYLQYLPQGYDSNSDKYPVVIALHGIMEKGTSSTVPRLVLRDLEKVARVGLPSYVKQGKKYPFILISPQLKYNYGLWPPSLIMEVLNHVKKELRIDQRRIYLTGLSLGGFGVWRTAGEYPEVFAAIAPICAGGNALDKARDIAAENLGVWGFHGSSDHIASYTITTKMINAINTAPRKPKPLAKVTIFPRMNHNVWDKAYKETNVLDWMLGFRNGSGPKSDDANDDSKDDSNSPPVARAGSDQTITLPDNKVRLHGKGSDSDGKVTSYRWEKSSGGNARIARAAQETTDVSDLSEGTYVFKLTVTDSDGASASDEVRVIVKASENQRPTVDAGNDRTIALPENSITLEGTASDADGQISAYAWTQVSGKRTRLSETTSAALAVSELAEGSYVFRLTVKDNDGGLSSDDVVVTVLEHSQNNNPPEVSAGSDQTVKRSEKIFYLRGKATDHDGSIETYAWTKVSGGSVNFSNAHTKTTTVSELNTGTYVFRLTVTDNSGAINSDDVTVVVSDGWQVNIQPADDNIEDRRNELPLDIVYPSATSSFISGD